MTTTATARSGARTDSTSDTPRLAGRLTGLAAVFAVVGAGGSLLRPDLLHGTPATDGNLRGTALVVLVVGVPLVLASARRAGRGSAVATVAWLAGLAFLVYQGVLFCFATPMNRLFPAYVAMLGLAAWAAVTLLVAIDLDRTALLLGPRTRLVPALVGGLATLNALAWLARAVPIAWTGQQPDSVSLSGLDTSPVLVQDLAFWLPLSIVAAVLAWRGRAWASTVAPALLLFYCLEGVSVASDQWWGVRADDDVPAVASTAAVPAGLALAVVLGAAWVWWAHRRREARA